MGRWRSFPVFGYYNSCPKFLPGSTSELLYVENEVLMIRPLPHRSSIRAELRAETLELDISGKKAALPLSSMITENTKCDNGYIAPGHWILGDVLLFLPSLPPLPFLQTPELQLECILPSCLNTTSQHPLSFCVLLILESPFTWSSLGPTPAHLVQMSMLW